MEPISVRRASWIAHVESWRDSSLTQAEYCRRHSLNTKIFAAWIKRCNTKSIPENLPLTLVPITVTQPVAAKELLLHHVSGWQLALPSTVEPVWLAGLLRGLV